MYVNPLSVGQPLLAAPHLPGLVAPQRFIRAHNPQDPTERFQAMIRGGGVIGGGLSTANPLKQIFVDGKPPTQGGDILKIVEAHNLLPRLREGAIPASAETVVDSATLRLSALAFLPANHKALEGRMLNVNKWPEWIPNFKSSKVEKMITVRNYVHEAKTEASGKQFHYRVLVQSQDIDSGNQIIWRLQKDQDFQVDEGCWTFSVNTGSCSFVSVPGESQQTLMAYQIDIAVGTSSIIQRLTKSLIQLGHTAIEVVALEKFPEAVRAMVNRARLPHWRPNEGNDNPFELEYTIQRYR